MIVIKLKKLWHHIRNRNNGFTSETRNFKYYSMPDILFTFGQPLKYTNSRTL